MFAVKLLLCDALKLENAVVEYATNGRQVVANFVAGSETPNPFTLMILKYNMPGLTGVEVVEAIDDFIRAKNLVGVRPFFIV